MNGKQAKKLRKAAMGLAVTLVEAGRKIHQDGLVAKKHVKSTHPMYSSAVPAEPQVEVSSVQALNREDSVRGIYRVIKKGVRSGKIPGGKK